MFKKVSPNLKFFLASFFISLPFWWGTNVAQKNLEDFLFWSQIVNRPQIFSAQIVPEKKLMFSKPVRNWQVENLEITAESGISLLVDSQGNQEILFDKDSNEKLPIASLTKLITADIVLEHYDLSQIIEISHQAVEEEGNSGEFKIGETLTVENLIYSLLIESSNDAAEALTEVIGKDAMVDLMNLETKAMGMENTRFFNPTGLEPDNPNGPINYSSTKDLATFVAYLLKTNPKILEISTFSEYNLYSPEGIFHHKLTNTNELLGESASWRTRIIGSKTGWTPQAQGCLLLAIKAPKDRGVIINIILGSPDRFDEMKKLINWIGEAYQW
jgi:D-alanyl-D-alanine carboxypeptidase